ncbi:hypothetical protein ACLB2K_073843 [Fragaria x ananassa]
MSMEVELQYAKCHRICSECGLFGHNGGDCDMRLLILGSEVTTETPSEGVGECPPSDLSVVRIKWVYGGGPVWAKPKSSLPSLFSLSSLLILSPSPSARKSPELFAVVRPPPTVTPVPIDRPSTQLSLWGGGSCPSAAKAAALAPPRQLPPRSSSRARKFQFPETSRHRNSLIRLP